MSPEQFGEASLLAFRTIRPQGTARSIGRTDEAGDRQGIRPAVARSGSPAAKPPYRNGWRDLWRAACGVSGRSTAVRTEQFLGQINGGRERQLRQLARSRSSDPRIWRSSRPRRGLRPRGWRIQQPEADRPQKPRTSRSAARSGERACRVGSGADPAHRFVAVADFRSARVARPSWPRTRHR